MFDKSNHNLKEFITLYSPYLSQIIGDNPAFFDDIITKTPKVICDKIFFELENYDVTKIDINKLKEDLRIFKKRLSLVFAVADISDSWTLEEVTSALTKLAEQTLKTACEFLIHSAVKEGKIAGVSLEDSGFFVIGMGKLGAYELNYSSDIDLIVLFDESKIVYQGNQDVKNFFQNLTKSLIAIMQERTANGYVFRTDLRLRPDPNSTPVAMSVGAAETYYESFGQNWERAAMIKARPVAGDIKAGYRFLKNIRPFVWRKTLDFKAIKDIHAIKGQILSRHSNNYNESLLGYNIKLGRGGIREIEFFAQSQQLIWGGRNPILQKIATCSALDALCETGYITAEVCEDLKKAYHFLRKIEHRLQMVDDRQTHELPKNNQDFEKIAFFSGFDNQNDFIKALEGNLKIVESYFAGLFDDTNSKKDVPEFVFEGAGSNSKTLEKLSKMGFENNAVIFNRINDWLNGHPRATRTSKAKELLIELLPTLLSALAETSNPDTAFARFDEFLYAQPSGVQLFYLFNANPSLFNLVAKVMGDAPSLASELKRKPELLDNLIEPDFFAPLPSKSILTAELHRLLEHTDSFEQKLDAFRRFKKYRSFQLCVQLFESIINGEVFGKEYSRLADIVITELKSVVSNEFARRYGYIKDAEMAIVAFGKAGSQEMSPNSDLDLIIIYDVPDINALSVGGEASLAPSSYFAKWTMRLINALNVMTAEGKLWDIDMRLRPSGNSGPLATSLSAFTNYQTKNAWIWEHQALTRARIIVGDDNISNKINNIIKDILSQKRDKNELVKAIREMRLKIAETHKSSQPFGIKYMEGGLVDIEFVVQYLKLANADKKEVILQPNTNKALLLMLQEKIIDKKTFDNLNGIYQFWLSINSLLSLTVDNDVDESNFSRGLKIKLAKIMGENKNFDDLKIKIKNNSEKIKEIYQKYFNERQIR